MSEIEGENSVWEEDFEDYSELFSEDTITTKKC